MSSRRLQDIFKTCLQDIFLKVSARRLQEDTLQTRLEDLLKTSWKTKNVTLKCYSSWWRRLQHVFIKTNVCWERILGNWEICDALHDLVPFAHFKNREKHPWRSVTFSKSNTPPPVFFTFFKCANGTKSRNTSHIGILEKSQIQAKTQPRVHSPLHK